MTIKIVNKFEDFVQDFKYESVYDRWISLKLPKDVSIGTMESKEIDLGMAVILPFNHEATIIISESLCDNYKVIMPNGIKVIDKSSSDNKDTWKIKILNIGLEEVKIPKGTILCKFRVYECMKPTIIAMVDDIDTKEKGKVINLYDVNMDGIHIPEIIKDNKNRVNSLPEIW